MLGFATGALLIARKLLAAVDDCLTDASSDGGSAHQPRGAWTGTRSVERSLAHRPQHIRAGGVPRLGAFAGRLEQPAVAEPPPAASRHTEKLGTPGKIRTYDIRLRRPWNLAVSPMKSRGVTAS